MSSTPGPAAAAPSQQISCRNCGATTDFEVTANVLRCAFCGSEQVVAQPSDPNRPTPESILSFVIEEEQARAAYREWLGNGFFRPGDLTKSASLREIRAVFLPFWAFDARANTQWTAMSGRHRTSVRQVQTVVNGQSVLRDQQVQETDWFPASGDHVGQYTWELVSASKGLEQAWVDAIEPFNFGELRAYDGKFLLGRGAEEAALDRAQAEDVARKLIEAKEQSECARLVPGDTHRDLRVSTALEDVAAKMIFLPVWLAAFAYKQKVYRFVVNGQTGKVTGEAPMSYLKVALVVGAVALVVLLIIAIVAMLK
ncbi:MAG: hypothetical protein IPF53_18845 [Blastocatellia bacterium]|jgi:hypothetical protein|nr:hypothetical protein [Blastocatellia bacterium]MBK6425726.1 hypothetical protein [Blastocatellia bacterium]